MVPTDLFENLYLFNGTFYFISSLPQDSPQRPPENGHILCGVPTDEGKRVDGGEDRFARISPEEASRMLGSKVAIRVDGSSVSVVNGFSCRHHSTSLLNQGGSLLLYRFGTMTRPILKLLRTWVTISIVSVQALLKNT